MQLSRNTKIIAIALLLVGGGICGYLVFGAKAAPPATQERGFSPH